MHNHVGHPAAATSLFEQIGHENLYRQENLTNNRLPNLLINMKAPYQRQSTSKQLTNAIL